MKNRKVEKIVIVVTALFIIISLIFMFGGNIFDKSTAKKTDSTVMPEATGTTNEIKKDIVVEQDFVNTTDNISKVGIVFNRLAYREGIDLALELLDGNDILASTVVNVASIEEQHRTFIEPQNSLSGMKNKTLTIRVYPVTKEDTGLVIMMNADANSSFRFGGKTIKGTLCFSVNE